MNLLGLPSVVQGKILGQLELHEFILLSLTSTKAFRVMQSSVLPKKKDVFLFLRWKSGGSNPMSLLVFDPGFDVCVRWLPTRGDPSLVTQRMMLNGKYDDYTYSTSHARTRTWHEIHIEGDIAEMLKQIYRHLVELLRAPVNVRCDLDPYKMRNSSFFRRMKQSFEYIRIYNRHIHSVDLEKFLTKSNIPKSMILETRVYPSLRNESKLLEIENVYIQDASFIRGVHLLNMHCSLVAFERTKLQDEDLIQFVNKWKEDTDNRLIFLFIKLENGFHLNPMTICEAVGAERWNPDHRPAVFDMEKMKTREKGFYHDLRPDQSNGRDVRGRSGLIGTLNFTRTAFSFIVWH